MAKKRVEEVASDVVELSAEAQAVQDAAQQVADAKAVLDQATAEHAEAVADHAAAVKATQPIADPAIHIGIEKPGGYDLLEHPEAKERLAKMTVGGRNVEHVSDGENGIWVYRPM